MDQSSAHPPSRPPGLAVDAPVGDDRRAGLRSVAMILMAVGIVGFLAAGGGFLLFLDTLTRQETEFGEPVDGIAALTGGSDRIGDALLVLEEGRAKRLLISGVNTQITDAALIRKAGHAELFRCCIDIGRNALNTVGNAVETAEWVRKHRYKSILLVTSNYHMPRAMVELRRHLKDVRIVPHPVIAESVRIESWWRDAGLTRLLFGEYMKYLASEVRSRLVPDNPRPAERAN